MLGLGDPIPTFIQRRLRQLDENGVVCICGIRSGQDKVLGLRNGQMVLMPRLSLKDGAAALKTVFLALLNPSRSLQLWHCRPHKSLRQNAAWFIAHLALVRLRQIHLIHLQWIGMASDYAWLRHFFHCPLIASARGSQVTVYPLTSPEYAKKLEACFVAVNRIHCVSEDIRLRCIQLGAPASKLFVNYNGIDVQFFAPAPQERSLGGEVQLISTGALIWRKGYYYQLQILQLLRKQGYPCQLLIIGAGPELQGLQYTAQLLGIDPWVSFLGSLPPEAVRDRLQNAHIYLSTSAAEGLANSVLEAAACGLPVVAFDCEGMKEIIEDGNSGYILPFGNIQLAAEQLKKLCDNETLYHKMSYQARKNTVARFNADFWVQDMKSQLSHILAHE
jgi:glycosyltransferase involved in cell wall biosynthesis